MTVFRAFLKCHGFGVGFFFFSLRFRVLPNGVACMLKKRFCLIFPVREEHVSALQFELGREGQGLEGVSRGMEEVQGERGSSSWSCADASLISDALKEVKKHGH